MAEVEVLGRPVARDAAAFYPGPTPDGDAIEEWVLDSTQRLDDAARWADDAVETVPRVRDLFEHFGTTVERHTGRRLLLLLDQLDRVNPVYFELLAQALGRSTTYTLVVATRPSPCAPEETRLDLGTGDCDRHWLGVDWTSSRWRDFLLDVAGQYFNSSVCHVLGQHADFLATVVGPSTRHFLRIGKYLAADHASGKALDVDAATTWMQDTFASELEGALTGFGDAPRFLRAYRQHLSARAEEAGGVWPRRMVLRPTKDALFLGARTEKRVRVAVREGLLVPAAPARYGLDGVGHEYEVVPLAALNMTASTFLRGQADVPIELDEDVLEGWGANRRRGKSPEGSDRPRVFYSHWMNARNEHAKQFLPVFEKYLNAQGVDVTTGESRASEPLAPMITEMIRTSTITAVQLDPFRPTIGLEIGWSIGSGKPILLGVSENAERDALPRWMRNTFQVKLNGTLGEQRSFAKAAVSLVDTAVAGSEDAHWKIDTEGSKLIDLHRALRKPVVIGSGPLLAPLVDQLNDWLALEHLPLCTVVDTSDSAAGGLIFEVIREAYVASILVTVMGGDRYSDLLACIGLGTHTHDSADRRLRIRSATTKGQQTATIPRRAFVVFVEGGQDHLPDLVYGMHKAVASSDPRRVSKAAFDQFLELPV